MKLADPPSGSGKSLKMNVKSLTFLFKVNKRKKNINKYLSDLREEGIFQHKQRNTYIFLLVKN